MIPNKKPKKNQKLSLTLGFTHKTTLEKYDRNFAKM